MMMNDGRAGGSGCARNIGETPPTASRCSRLGSASRTMRSGTTLRARSLAYAARRAKCARSATYVAVSNAMTIVRSQNTCRCGSAPSTSVPSTDPPRHSSVRRRRACCWIRRDRCAAVEVAGERRVTSRSSDATGRARRKPPSAERKVAIEFASRHSDRLRRTSGTRAISHTSTRTITTKLSQPPRSDDAEPRQGY
jgi:hypothetical protein